MTTATKKRRGRPPGPRKPVATVSVPPTPPSACPACSSEARAPYTNTRTRPIPPVDRGGVTYRVKVWRRTSCADCGQVRDDTTLQK